MIVCVDFDDTIVLRRVDGLLLDFVGPVPHAIDMLKAMNRRGYRLILWTMRDGNHLHEALEFLRRHGVAIWAANKNPEQYWSGSNKAYCNLLIDDNAFGCPLVDDGVHRPYVDWTAVRRELGLEI